MKAQVYLPEDEMIRRALDALISVLGPVEATRFLAISRQRRLDAVERHRRWQAGLEKDQFFDQVFGPPEPAS